MRFVTKEEEKEDAWEAAVAGKMVMAMVTMALMRTSSGMARDMTTTTKVMTAITLHTIAKKVT